MRSAIAMALGAMLALAPVQSDAQTVTPAAGYFYTKQVLSDLTQSCIAAGAGGTFVGQGPGFTGNGQRIVFASESGGERVVASGFNSISDCVYDAAGDVLYVTDNALEAVGALTGDTVFAIVDASTTTAAAAVGLEVVAAGSIPSAFGVTLDGAGDLLVTDAAGSAAGSLRKLAGGSASTLVGSGLEYPSGIAVDAAGDILVADSLPSFENQVVRYDGGGNFVEIVSGPTFAHGSYDLEINSDGRLLVSGAFGGDVVSLDPGTGGLESFASGLTFATGLEVDRFTGRVEILSSTFSFPDPVEEDVTIHRFVPAARLVAGKGAPSKSCVHRFYGVELVPAKQGKPAKDAICVDGAACDADGRVNDACLFPLGFCAGVADEPGSDCTATGLAAFELKKSKPDSAELAAAAAALQAQLPVLEPACSFSDGFTVPVKIASNGRKKAGKGVVKTKAESTDGKAVKDVDALKLVCLPAEP